MRTIDQLYAEIRQADPETALTRTAIRRLVVTGQLPHVTVGTKYLVDLDALEAFMQGNTPAAEAPAPGYGEIRPVR